MVGGRQPENAVVVKENLEITQLKSAIAEVLGTEAGRIVWAGIFHLCGYSVSSLERRTDKEIADLATACKEAQRMVYVQLRRLAPRELLRDAEYFAETPKGEGG